MLRPYFVRDYNKLVRALIANEPDYATGDGQSSGRGVHRDRAARASKSSNLWG